MHGGGYGQQPAAPRHMGHGYPSMGDPNHSGMGQPPNGYAVGGQFGGTGFAAAPPAFTNAPTYGSVNAQAPAMAPSNSIYGPGAAYSNNGLSQYGPGYNSQPLGGGGMRYQQRTSNPPQGNSSFPIRTNIVNDNRRRRDQPIRAPVRSFKDDERNKRKLPPQQFGQSQPKFPSSAAKVPRIGEPARPQTAAAPTPNRVVQPIRNATVSTSAPTSNPSSTPIRVNPQRSTPPTSTTVTKPAAGDADVLTCSTDDFSKILKVLFSLKRDGKLEDRPFRALAALQLKKDLQLLEIFKASQPDEDPSISLSTAKRHELVKQAFLENLLMWYNDDAPESIDASAVKARAEVVEASAETAEIVEASAEVLAEASAEGAGASIEAEETSPDNAQVAVESVAGEDAAAHTRANEDEGKGVLDVEEASVVAANSIEEGAAVTGAEEIEEVTEVTEAFFYKQCL